MRKLALMLCLATGGAIAHADTPMTAAEFDAYTRHKTFYYGSNGQAYGAEEHLSNRRVIWTFLDGACHYGTWYPDGDQICFVYDNLPDPQCWRFQTSESGLIAQFENDPAQTELYEVENNPTPLICPGPEVGV